MFNKKLAYKIKNVLFQNNDKYLTIKSISKIIRIHKHQYKDLKDTLVQLAKEKKIIRQGHGYKTKKTKKGNISNNKKFVSGKFDATSLSRNHSFAFVITPDFDVLIHGNDIGNAYHNDEVNVELTYQRGNRYHGIITKINKRANKTVVGTVQKYRKKYLLVCDSNKIHTNMIINKIEDAKENEKVVIKVTNWGTSKYLPTGNVIEVLGDADDPKVEVLAIIRQNNLPLFFEEEILNEADAIEEVTDVPENEKRTDLRDLLTFTIDPISAKDYDDAISLEVTKTGYKLFVHIADVAHFVHPKSKIFGEAEKRGNSYYFPKMVIPMLPEKLSNGVCSLRPNEDKRTITTKFILDKKFNVINSRVFKSLICSNSRLNYEQV
ncbi:MAG: RNB domain-containing ribonuclease, partial [Candidatus Cloacimonadota bacterium]|nr:RNB domain-containing ribonuclease [Candidatus Cloacimonadota bacterium]